MRPNVSIVMPVWNGAKYLSEAVESILAQTFINFEFIIVDDGSTDDTWDILSRQSDPRVRLIRLVHGGIVAALNTGIAAAHSELIARMDADDIANRERIEHQFLVMYANRDLVLCHTNIEYIGENAEIPKAVHFPRSQGLIATQLCFRCPIIHSTTMFRKEAFLQAGGYLQAECHAEDYGLWGRLIRLGSVIGLPDKLLKFRIHPLSISKTQNAVQASIANEIAIRHCRDLLKLDEVLAKRAYGAFNRTTADPLRDWFWLVSKCLTKLPWQSTELWAWVGSQSLRRISTFH